MTPGPTTPGPTPATPPPPVTPRPPADEVVVERDPFRRLRTWLVVLTVLTIAALGAAGYAISEIESTKDENREDDQAVGALRADLDVLREQLTERLDAVERRVDDAADAKTQRKLQDDLDAIDKRVTKLDKQDDGGESDEITTRVDDLEQRIEDLENDKSSN
jgi:DNA-binding transcriptional MerR regulator